jgi:hypothetical protein
MTIDPRLERYLTSLEQALKPFPVSDRAEIITEIKSHVLSALDRDPQTRLDTVLSALGEPETVANRYLLERGMKPTKPSISPIVKWLVIGFLGTFAMILIFTGFVVSQSGSLFKIDGKKGRVQVLNGLIDIDGENDQVSVGGFDGGDSGAVGAKDLKAGQTVTVKFNSGKFEVKTSDDGKFGWACRSHGAKVPTVANEADGIAFDLSELSSVRCKFGIPENTHLIIKGANGKIDFESPRFDIAADLGNGKVDFQLDKKTPYKFETAIEAGKMDKFESSTQAGAHSVKVHVTNGSITNND